MASVLDQDSVTMPILRVVDDDPSHRRATARLLMAAGYQVRAFASARELLAGDALVEPGAIVLDAFMPEQSGLELQRQLAASPEPLPIVFLSGHSDVPTSVTAMKAGAVDFLTKPVESGALLEAVRRAVAIDQASRRHRAEMLSFRARIGGLTPREREVFELVTVGMINKEIAGQLGTTERTVKAHRAQVMEKLNATSVAELVRIADRAGIHVGRRGSTRLDEASAAARAPSPSAPDSEP